jgi:hypothetical protein
MAASVSNSIVLKTLHPDEFKTRLACNRALLPADGIDVPIVLDLAGCHSKPRVLASCTSGQELLFSETIVKMVRELAAATPGATVLRVRFSDRDVATLPGKAAARGGAGRTPQQVADGLVAALVELFGPKVVAAAMARAGR